MLQAAASLLTRAGVLAARVAAHVTSVSAAAHRSFSTKQEAPQSTWPQNEQECFQASLERIADAKNLEDLHRIARNKLLFAETMKNHFPLAPQIESSSYVWFASILSSSMLTYACEKLGVDTHIGGSISGAVLLGGILGGWYGNKKSDEHWERKADRAIFLYKQCLEGKFELNESSRMSSLRYDLFPNLYSRIRRRLPTMVAFSMRYAILQSDEKTRDSDTYQENDLDV